MHIVDAFTMCDGSDYVSACFLFFHWAVGGKRICLVYVIQHHLMHKRSKYMVVAQIERIIKLFETI